MSLHCSSHILHGCLWPSKWQDIPAPGFPFVTSSHIPTHTHSPLHSLIPRLTPLIVFKCHIRLANPLILSTVLLCVFALHSRHLCMNLLPLTIISSLSECISKFHSCCFDNFQLILNFWHAHFALDSQHIQFTLDATLTWPISLPFSL